MNPAKILVINFGSTSTKIALFEDDECSVRDNIAHPAEQIAAFADYKDQYILRRQAILSWLAEKGVRLDELDAISCRGGHSEPIIGGTYRINEAMIAQAMSDRYGRHVCNLGPRIAYDLAVESGRAIPYTTDIPTTDELEPLARYSGLPEITRISSVQALNTKAMARWWAEQNGHAFEDVRVITAMLGGGIGICAIKGGRMVDAPNALEGEGPFSNNRCCTVPVGALVDLCYSGDYTQAEMHRHINGDAGLKAYLGTTDIREIMGRIEGGDAQAREVMEAMCYQAAKEIGAMAAVLEGDVDAILFFGGMANVPFIVDHIKERVEFIAPVVVMPGEREMESLGENAYKALTGQIETLVFEPSVQADAPAGARPAAA